MKTRTRAVRRAWWTRTQTLTRRVCMPRLGQGEATCQMAGARGRLSVSTGPREIAQTLQLQDPQPDAPLAGVRPYLSSQRMWTRGSRNSQT